MSSFFRLILLVLERVIPVKKGRIVCTSFGGGYSDSPKYIARGIRQLKPDAEIVWLVSNESKAAAEREFKTIPINSSLGRYYASSAEIRIDNVYGDFALFTNAEGRLQKIKRKILCWLSIKKRQRTYTTWHGTPIKRMGRDQIGNDITDFFCGNVTMFLDNQYTLDIMRHITFDKVKMVRLGLPRNDALFLPEEEKTLLKERMGLPQGKKLLLFAPTFRNDGKDTEQKNIYRSGLDQLQTIDFDRLFQTLSSKFGGDWVFICRFHYHVASLVDWDEIARKYKGKVINGNENEDMAEYLACADVLVTDASSCFFDFSLTDKPTFLFFPDYEHYKDKERGFYLSMEELPCAVNKTFDEFLESIANYDDSAYKSSLKQMFEKMGYIHEREAAKAISEYILADSVN